jgi:hypothetical protein
VVTEETPEVELTDADVEYVDYEDYDGEPTLIEMLPDGTRARCPGCWSYWTECKCKGETR